MTRDDDIYNAYNNGLRTSSIAKQHGISTRQVQRILYGKGNNKPRGKSADNQLASLRQIIIALMQEQGRDFTVCELCNKPIPNGKFDLHHVKYDGATFYDLRIVCRLCNTAPLNRYLV